MPALEIIPSGVALDTTLQTIDTKLDTLVENLGTPFQSNGDIGNTEFSVTQSGSWNVNIPTTVSVVGPLTDTQLRSTPVTVSGTFWQTTQPVSIVASPVLEAIANTTNQTLINANITTLNSKIPELASGRIPVTLPVGFATDSAIASVVATLGSPFQQNGIIGNTVFGATQSGSWSVGIEGTVPVTGPLTDTQLRATPIPVTGSFYQATQPVSITGLTASSGNPTQSDTALTVSQKPISLWSATFAEVGSGLLSPKFTQRRLGTGVTVSQSASNLVVVAGTTASSEFLAKSVASFNGAFIHRFKTLFSQRIANNNFAIMLADCIGENLSYTINSSTSVSITVPSHGFTSQNVGQFMCLGNILGAVGVPGRYAISSIVDSNTINFTVSSWPASGTGTLDLFGWNYYRTLYNGTSATNALFDAQRKGWASGDTNATINTTASPGHIVQLSVDGRSAYLADALTTSTATPSITTRANRYENLPDTDTLLYMYIWSYNASSAPASSTTWTIGFTSLEDTVNNTVYIAGIRQLGQSAPLSVSWSGSQSVSVASGTINTVTSVTAANLSIPVAITDIASSAITTTTTTSAIIPTFGTEYEVVIPVTAVTGTNPTMDIVVQESDDSGTNWLDVHHFPRITTTGTYRSPKTILKGNRVRYVQTLGGTSPSFTRTITRLQGSSAFPLFRRRIFDRLVNVNTLNATTAVMSAPECTNLQLIVNMGAITTTAPQFKIQGSDDNGISWYDISNTITAVANASVQLTVNNVTSDLTRVIVSTAGSGATLGYVSIKGF